MNADMAVRLYLHLMNGGDQLQSRTLVDSEEVCSRRVRDTICGGKRSSKGKIGRQMTICVKCGQPWTGVVVPILEPRHRKSGRETVCVKQRCKKARRDKVLAIERAAEWLCVLRPVIETRPHDMTRAEWVFCLLALAISIEGDGRSLPKTVEIGLERYPTAATPRRWWSEWMVRQACADARQKIERRLARKQRGVMWRDGSVSLKQRDSSESALGKYVA